MGGAPPIAFKIADEDVRRRYEEAAVVLGIESCLNGEQNVRLLGRINQESVRIYAPTAFSQY